MSCPSCNAPMADDQRYCLNCGARGGDARLPFLEILRAKADAPLVPYGQPLRGPGTAVAAVPAPVGVPERLRTNAGLIAGVGVLLLAMLVGVLIGSGGDDAPAAAAAPAPQVISVAGGGTAAPVEAGATGATGAEEAAAATAASGAAKKSSSSKAKKAAAAAASTSNAPVRATSKAVQDLDKLTGAARQKAVEKLGKNIATGGKPPPKDSKPAAAGGEFEEIG